MHMYKITADYRPNNPNKPHYYILAENEKAAKKTFKRTYSWLKVYGIEPIPADEARIIWADPYRRPVNWIACNMEDIV